MTEEKIKELEKQVQEREDYIKTLELINIGLSEETVKELEREKENLKGQLQLAQNELKDKETVNQELTQQNTDLKKEKTELDQLKKTIHNALHRVYSRWNSATIIERGKENEVLGDNWAENLQEKKTIQEVNEKENELIAKIDDAKKKEEENQKGYEEEIQAEIDKANSFVNNFNLSAQDSNNLLEKLRTFRDKWGVGSNPAQWQAFFNKDKEGALRKLIRELQARIRGEEAINLIAGALNKEPILRATELGDEYANFPTRLRGMKEEEINKYENRALELSSSIRPVRAKIRRIIDLAKKILKNKDNSQENVFNLIFDLTKFRESKKETDEVVWLVYINCQEAVEDLVNPRNGELFGIARKQALFRLNRTKELLGKWGIHVNQTEFASYQRNINQANLQELQVQKYENEFLINLGQQAQIQQPPKT